MSKCAICSSVRRFLNHVIASCKGHILYTLVIEVVDGAVDKFPYGSVTFMSEYPFFDVDFPVARILGGPVTLP